MMRHAGAHHEAVASHASALADASASQAAVKPGGERQWGRMQALGNGVTVSSSLHSVPVLFHARNLEAGYQIFILRPGRRVLFVVRVIVWVRLDLSCKPECCCPAVQVNDHWCTDQQGASTECEISDVGL